ncbi:MAG: GAF domain-containing protein [Rhizobacter sp.]|nr:GAF domain-containing protein [Chlorobiales bacterium]
MSDSSKIHIFDHVGLDDDAVKDALKFSRGVFEYHSPERAIDELGQQSLSSNGEAKLLLLVDITTLHRVRQLIPRGLEKLVAIAIISSPEELTDYGDYTQLLDSREVFDIIETPVSSMRLGVLLRRTQLYFQYRGKLDVLRYELSEQQDELKKLNEIGVALSSEQDISTLLELILTISMDITNADAGTLYIVEENTGATFDKHNYLANKQLRFKYSKNFTKGTSSFLNATMPITPKSISGYVAMSGKSVELNDVYEIPEGTPYGFNPSFDRTINYRTKSMLVIPMLNRDKETIGVIQLLNKKRDANAKLMSESETHKYVIPFNQKDENFIGSMASQAAVAYENRLLYDSIRVLFEGFIQASVTAIEARDPTTSGHSGRVATLTVGIAEIVDKSDRPPFKDVKFTRQDLQEIKYASLLHDFGKIGVREPVLVKARKLYEEELSTIKNRYEIMKKAVELRYTREKVQYLLDKSRDEALKIIGDLDRQCNDKLLELDEFLQFILKVNEPTVMRSEGFGKLKEIQSKIFAFNDDEVYTYLTDIEAARLSIPKGSLDEAERREIESHVTHTYNFLKQIPWTNDLRNVPIIAYSHHEKLDGSGYPLKLGLDAIPVQSKMMTISDIYDALTANDRPYKRAVPIDRALDILGYEVKEKKVDSDLFNLFVDSKVFELTLSADVERAS